MSSINFKSRTSASIKRDLSAKRHGLQYIGLLPPLALNQFPPAVLPRMLTLKQHFVILASVKSCRFLRLRGVRSCADSARGTRSPGPLFSPAGGTGTAAVAAALCPPRQNDGGAGGYLRQNFSTVSIATLETAYVSNYFHTSHDSMTDMRPM